ncbi:CXXC motif containing zinc binding protein-like [Paramacrobiotus metropolitanus]|uniref:CXXC motif containing zinc binding protein-like n=1 Tax=Paramacrobiotus metropolitanus TaxID=2943436 RepID=UPI002445B25D|nr:CXXC motif containing zinc binding protein-like [Paramacrobiotus metropolitanus]
MPKFNLDIRCQLENVKEFVPASIQTFEWRIKFRCTGCNEERDTFRVVTIGEKFPQSNSRGESNLVETCNFCGNKGTVDILEKAASFPYCEGDSGQFKSVCTLDCRGLEPVNFDFGHGYCVYASHSSQKFSDVDLSEKEWTDYDEIAKESIGIMELEHKFVRK